MDMDQALFDTLTGAGLANRPVLDAFWRHDIKNIPINDHGTYTYVDGSRYTGMFANDMRDGYGVYVYASGNKFLGAWEEDK
jgi:hypothetical protein